MDTREDDNDDQGENDEAGASTTADGGRVKWHPDGDEAIDRRENYQPSGKVEDNVQQECYETARHVGHVHQLETGHLQPCTTTPLSHHHAILVLNDNFAKCYF